MTDPDDQRKRPSPTRIGIWVLAAGVGIYMLVSGLSGVLAGQS